MIIISFFNTSDWEKLLTPEERNNGQIVEIFFKNMERTKENQKNNDKKKQTNKKKKKTQNRIGSNWVDSSNMIMVS